MYIFINSNKIYAMVSHVRIDILSREGELLLGEKHSVKISDEGLLGIPDRLEVNASNLLCFPTKEEAGDIANRGDPFTAICRIFSPGSAAVQALPILMNTGYSISADGTAQLWVRVEGRTNTTVSSSGVGQTGFVLEEPTSQISRDHLCAEVKNRMKMLCNNICPRSLDGVMLPERAHAGLRRPAWCLEEILNILGEEFEASKLKGAREKALKYMSNSALSFKRLRSISPEDWEHMGETERAKKKPL
jgi:hypothetical protein